MSKSIQDQLRENTEELINIVNSFEQSIVNKKPSPDQWSIIEVCDHLISTDYGIYSMLSSEGVVAPEGRESKVETILKTAPDRTRKVKAPEMLQPKGKTDTQEKFSAKLKSLRDKMINASQEKDLTRICDVFPHFVFGQMTFEEWLQFSMAHATRHKMQMEEIAVALTSY